MEEGEDTRTVADRPSTNSSNSHRTTGEDRRPHPTWETVHLPISSIHPPAGCLPRKEPEDRPSSNLRRSRPFCTPVPSPGRRDNNNNNRHRDRGFREARTIFRDHHRPEAFRDHPGLDETPTFSFRAFVLRSPRPFL